VTLDAAKEFFSCLALRHTPGIGPRSWKTVLAAYSSAFEAVSDARNWTARKLLPRHRAEVFLREDWRSQAEAEYKAARAQKLLPLTWFDPRYPKRLREIPDPPVLLYAQGDLSLLKNPAVAVVGARECTHFGLSAVERISADLSRSGVTVVSGLAMGIDRQAHQAALTGLGSSIAVLGAGLDIHYPPENESVRQMLQTRGLVLTEYGPGTRPEARNFPCAQSHYQWLVARRTGGRGRRSLRQPRSIAVLGAGWTFTTRRKTSLCVRCCKRADWC